MRSLGTAMRVAFVGVVCAVGMGLAGGTLPAQCDPGSGMGGVGPDVMVGEIFSFADSYGGTGDYYAYAIGARCANIGTTDLAWTATTAAHPVIAQNLYRYKNGRFEQVGMSWLKHAFLALNIDSFGCGCIPSGPGLGPGCADPYGASLSGNQPALGPRSDVFDPVAGLFSFPVQTNAPIVDVTSRRLRALRSDIAPGANPGATWFVESHYVAADDAAAGNGNNNASYAEVSFANDLDFTMSVTGPTVGQKPAIDAWQQLDPSVVLVPLDDPDGGRIVVGAKATPVPGTTLYDYEYAVYNMNSTLAVGTVQVACGAGGTVSQIGFHDIDHHSGEPFSGLDWVGAFLPAMSGGPAVSWQTTPSAVDPFANAIRWGTLYNFRFRSNAAPEMGTVTLGLFLASNPASLTATLPVPGAFVDCNGNGIADGSEILAGAPDCDGDGVLDSCEPDCNGNGIADDCDIAGGGSSDTNADGVPDECVPFIRADANADGLLDLADAILSLGVLFQGSTVDCQATLDANSDALVDIADPVYVLTYLFSGGTAPSFPFPDCAVEVTLPCDSHGACVP